MLLISNLWTTNVNPEKEKDKRKTKIRKINQSENKNSRKPKTDLSRNIQICLTLHNQKSSKMSTSLSKLSTKSGKEIISVH
jgi:hypothetical protein